MESSTLDAIITIKRDGALGQRYEFDDRNWCSIGSHRDCDIWIQADHVAVLHALVTVEDQPLIYGLDEELSVEIPTRNISLTSSHFAPLLHGDVFFVGERAFRFQSANGPVLATPAVSRTLSRVSGTADPPKLGNVHENESLVSSEATTETRSKKKKKSKKSRMSLLITDNDEQIVDGPKRATIIPKSRLSLPASQIAQQLVADNNLADPAKFNPTQPRPRKSMPVYNMAAVNINVTYTAASSSTVTNVLGVKRSNEAHVSSIPASKQQKDVSSSATQASAISTDSFYSKPAPTTPEKTPLTTPAKSVPLSNPITPAKEPEEEPLAMPVASLDKSFQESLEIEPLQPIVPDSTPGAETPVENEPPTTPAKSTLPDTALFVPNTPPSTPTKTPGSPAPPEPDTHELLSKALTPKPHTPTQERIAPVLPPRTTPLIPGDPLKAAAQRRASVLSARARTPASSSGPFTLSSKFASPPATPRRLEVSTGRGVATPLRPGLTPARRNAPAEGAGTPRVVLGTPLAGAGTPRFGPGPPLAGVRTPLAGVRTPRAGVGTPRAGVGTPRRAAGTPGRLAGTPRRIAPATPGRVERSATPRRTAVGLLTPRRHAALLTPRRVARAAASPARRVGAPRRAAPDPTALQPAIRKAGAAPRLPPRTPKRRRLDSPFVPGAPPADDAAPATRRALDMQPPPAVQAEPAPRTPEQAMPRRASLTVPTPEAYAKAVTARGASDADDEEVRSRPGVDAADDAEADDVEADAVQADVVGEGAMETDVDKADVAVPEMASPSLPVVPTASEVSVPETAAPAGVEDNNVDRSPPVVKQKDVFVPRRSPRGLSASPPGPSPPIIELSKLPKASAAARTPVQRTPRSKRAATPKTPLSKAKKTPSSKKTGSKENKEPGTSVPGLKNSKSSELKTPSKELSMPAASSDDDVHTSIPKTPVSKTSSDPSSVPKTPVSTISDRARRLSRRRSSVSKAEERQQPITPEKNKKAAEEERQKTPVSPLENEKEEFERAVQRNPPIPPKISVPSTPTVGAVDEITSARKPPPDGKFEMASSRKPPRGFAQTPGVFKTISKTSKKRSLSISFAPQIELPKGPHYSPRVSKHMARTPQSASFGPNKRILRGSPTARPVPRMPADALVQGTPPSRLSALGSFFFRTKASKPEAPSPAGDTEHDKERGSSEDEGSSETVDGSESTLSVDAGESESSDPPKSPGNLSLKVNLESEESTDDFEVDSETESVSEESGRAGGTVTTPQRRRSIGERLSGLFFGTPVPASDSPQEKGCESPAFIESSATSNGSEEEELEDTAETPADDGADEESSPTKSLGASSDNAKQESEQSVDDSDAESETVSGPEEDGKVDTPAATPQRRRSLGERLSGLFFRTPVPAPEENVENDSESPALIGSSGTNTGTEEEESESTAETPVAEKAQEEAEDMTAESSDNSDTNSPEEELEQDTDDVEVVSESASEASPVSNEDPVLGKPATTPQRRMSLGARISGLFFGTPVPVSASPSEMSSESPAVLGSSGSSSGSEQEEPRPGSEEPVAEVADDPSQDVVVQSSDKSDAKSEESTEEVEVETAIIAEKDTVLDTGHSVEGSAASSAEEIETESAVDSFVEDEANVQNSDAQCEELRALLASRKVADLRVLLVHFDEDVKGRKAELIGSLVSKPYEQVMKFIGQEDDEDRNDKTGADSENETDEHSDEDGKVAEDELDLQKKYEERKAELKSMTVKKLQGILGKLKLDKMGKKDNLVDRILSSEISESGGDPDENVEEDTEVIEAQATEVKEMTPVKTRSARRPSQMSTAKTPRTTRASRAAAAAMPREEVAEKKSVDLQSMTVAKLRKYLRENASCTFGLKAVLLKRAEQIESSTRRTRNAKDTTECIGCQRGNKCAGPK